VSRRRGADNRWLIPTLLLFVVVPVAGAVTAAVGGGGDDGGEPFFPTRTPASYAITYTVTDMTQSRPTRTTERVQVRRPFESRVEVADAGGRVIGARASRLGALATQGGDGRWRELSLGPALATGDLRPGPALRDALERGWIDVRGRKEVVGRRCQVFRSGSTIAAGTLQRLARGGRDFADTCIDEAGLVLEEEWHIGGRRVQRRVAPAVDERAGSFDSAPDAEPVGESDGGGSSVEVKREGLPPGFFLDLRQAPSGFEHRGRYAVVPPRVDVGRNPLSQSSQAVSTAIVDVWVKGADMLVVEQGTRTDPNVGLPVPTTPVDVDLGPLGRGQGFVDFRTSEVRAELPAGAFVRIYGTLPLAELTRVAKQLEPRTDGTGLIPA
jgi:hypothetical protein